MFGCDADVGFKYDWLVPTPVTFPDGLKDRILGYCIEINTNYSSETELNPISSRPDDQVSLLLNEESSVRDDISSSDRLTMISDPQGNQFRELNCNQIEDGVDRSVTSNIEVRDV